MKKRIIVLGLVAIMILQMLAGCSKKTTNEGGKVKGEDTGTELQIGVVAKGYGDEFAVQLAKAFQEKTGIKTEVVKSSSSSSWVSGHLKSGAEINDIDIFFDIRNKAMYDIAVDEYLEGYERAYVDLSDIYNEVPEGYGIDKPLKEIVNSYSLSACTWDLHGEGYGDGKQYFVNYVTGLEGLVYNVDLFEKYNLTEPRTTKEFFALMDKMKTMNKGSYAKNGDGRSIYPFVYSGKVDYSQYLATVWWAQYDGADAFDLMLQGKDLSGNYSADSLKSQGKLSAMKHVYELVLKKNGYVADANYTTNFTNAQLLFLDQQAFMMSTGEWLEREMSSNFADMDMNIAFMKIPVNSDIIMQCNSVTTEERLVETIAYIDGDVKTRPAYLSDGDLKKIQEARSMYCSEGNQHIAYIPAYSNMVESAKEFFRFMLSKEGQEIMMKYSYGNMAPLNVNVKDFKEYDSISDLQKSKYEIITSSNGLTLLGNNYSYPMGYTGSIMVWYNNPTLENAFGGVESSATFKTPMEIWKADYELRSTNWSTYMSRAGVRN